MLSTYICGSESTSELRSTDEIEVKNDCEAGLQAEYEDSHIGAVGEETLNPQRAIGNTAVFVSAAK